MEKKLTKYALAGAVGVQLFVIFLCNYFKGVDMLDYDSSMAVRHAVDMWRHGTVFLPNFVYPSSMEIDCASFLAAPIYILTGNWGLGISIAHLFLDGLLAYIIYRLLKNLNVPYAFCILGILLVFSPYKYGQLDWNNMIFLSVGQYEFRLISTLFLFLMLSYREAFGKWHWVRYGICQIFIFITVLSTGNYFIITVLVPLLLYEGFRILREEKLDWKNQNLRLVLGSVLTALCAYGINRGAHIMLGRSNMNILKGIEFSDNLMGCFAGVFALFGGLVDGDVPILSAEGIFCLVRFLLTCVMLLLAVAAFLKRKELKDNKEFLWRFLFLFLANMLVLLYTNTRYGNILFEVRYHIIWCVLLMMVDVMFFSVAWEKLGRWMKKAVVICVSFGLLIINISGFRTVWSVTDWTRELMAQTLNTADAYDLREIIVVDGSVAKKMNAIDIDKNVYFGWIHEESGMLGFNTLGGYEDFRVAASNLMLIRDADYQKLAPEIKSAYQEVGIWNEWHILLTDVYEW